MRPVPILRAGALAKRLPPVRLREIGVLKKQRLAPPRYFVKARGACALYVSGQGIAIPRAAALHAQGPDIGVIHEQRKGEALRRSAALYKATAIGLFKGREKKGPKGKGRGKNHSINPTSPKIGKASEVAHFLLNIEKEIKLRLSTGESHHAAPENAVKGEWGTSGPIHTDVTELCVHPREVKPFTK